VRAIIVGGLKELFAAEVPRGATGKEILIRDIDSARIAQSGSWPQIAGVNRPFRTLTQLVALRRDWLPVGDFTPATLLGLSRRSRPRSSGAKLANISRLRFHRPCVLQVQGECYGYAPGRSRPDRGWNG
jgi:hypothetical protein